MNPLHARYPYFGAARDAVEAADISLSALVSEDDPAVERGRERVERALLVGTAEAETPTQWSPRDELLSYPVARILVSLIDAPAAVRKYAAAEASAAYERFLDDFERDDDELRSTSRPSIDLDDFLREFDLTSVVQPEQAPRGRDPEWFRVSVGTYLRLMESDWGDEWRLVNRELVAGAVRVERTELYRLLREAVRRRVGEGLPFTVRGTPDGDAIADALDDRIDSLRDLLADRDTVGDIDTVVPELFPPCMTNLVERARREADLDPYAQFALMAFLTGIGMDADEIVSFCDATSLDKEGIRYQVRYLRDDRGTQYPPPSCETLAAYGVCHNEEEHWKISAYPLVYYEKRLAATDDEYVDWRERPQEAQEANPESEA